jgi:hypothetical protein
MSIRTGGGDQAQSRHKLAAQLASGICIARMGSTAVLPIPWPLQGCGSRQAELWLFEIVFKN